MDEAESKTCPDCAETVKGAAKVCRFCGHRFDANRQSPVRPRTSGAQKGWRLVALAIAVTLIVMVVWIVRAVRHHGLGYSSAPYAVCTVSSNQHDVNLVITGNGAQSFCTSQSSQLSGAGSG